MKTRLPTLWPHLLTRLACLVGLSVSSAGAIGADSAVILTYHHVAEETPHSTSIKPADFARQMQYLAEGPFAVIDLGEYLEARRTGAELPDYAVVVTFDDAYRSVLTTALPILESHGFPATVFVATDAVGTNDRLYLTWDELREMKARGISIANHSATHTHLIRLEPGESQADWRERITADITRAQSAIERELGDAPSWLAYPYGEFNKDVQEIVRELGYFGLAQHSGAAGPRSSPLAIPRYAIGGNYTGFDSFRTKARTLPLPVTSPAREALDTGVTHEPTLELELAEGNWRIEELACYGPGGRLPVSVDGTRVTVSALQPVPVGRSRYNCTMPSMSGRYYWYSQPWFRKRDDGTWYPES